METEFDNTLRVCDTETLLRLMREGREQQYNRTCPPELEAELDPQGTHLITLSLLHYYKQAEPCPVHARLMMLIKLRDQEQPQEIILDASLEETQALPELESAARG
jgi:hypothetical protein